MGDLRGLVMGRGEDVERMGEADRTVVAMTEEGEMVGPTRTGSSVFGLGT